MSVYSDWMSEYDEVVKEHAASFRELDAKARLAERIEDKDLVNEMSEWVTIEATLDLCAEFSNDALMIRDLLATLSEADQSKLLGALHSGVPFSKYTTSEISSFIASRVVATPIEKRLKKVAIKNTGAGNFVIYKPVTPYSDNHGLVQAELIEWDGEELTTSTYYSLGWAYWNFCDIDGDDFSEANSAMCAEALNGKIDYEIGIKTEAVEQINNDTIPHQNAYWQSLVVRTAYSAITDVEEFANICRNSPHTQEQVQRMIDVAVGAVLSNPRFTITGFQTDQA